MNDNNQNLWDEEDAEYIDSFDGEDTDAALSYDEPEESVRSESADSDAADYDSYEEYDEDEDYDDDDDYEERPRSIGHTILYMTIVLLLSVGFAVLLWFAADDVLALTKPDNVVTVTIDEYDSLYDVAVKLQEHGLVRYKYLFMVYGKFSHAENKIGPGTFDLNQMFDYHALVNGLVSTSETRKTVTLTFPEGYTMDQIFNMLSENDVCDEEKLRETAANYEFEQDFLQGIPYGEENRLEGFMFPDTYEFYIGDDPVRVINKFLNNFDSKISDPMLEAINDLNDNIRSRMEEEGSFTEEDIQAAMMDIYKVITIASLIEKEAGSDSERTLISAVIYNRLTTRVHELLQIDATVEYALGEHKPVLTANDLGVDSPYNTYKYKGLPPGPIACPGIASIMAAIYPDDSDYFFYALNDYGTHDFFYTYIEQQNYLNSRAEEQQAATDETQQQPDTTTAEAETETEAVEEPFYQETVTGEDGEEETILVQ